MKFIFEFFFNEYSSCIICLVTLFKKKLKQLFQWFICSCLISIVKVCFKQTWRFLFIAYVQASLRSEPVLRETEGRLHCLVLVGVDSVFQDLRSRIDVGKTKTNSKNVVWKFLGLFKMIFDVISMRKKFSSCNSSESYSS